MNGISTITFGNEVETGLANLAALQNKRMAERQERFNEEFKQKTELMKLIDPKVLNQNLETEISNEAINQVRENVKNWLLDKKNEWASAGQLQSMIQNEVGKITNWNNSFKTIKNNIEEQAKNMPADPKVSKDLWVKAAKSAALFKDGRVKTLEELTGDNTDWMQKTWETAGDKFIRIDEIQSDNMKTLTSLPKDDQTVSRTVGATNKKGGETKQFKISVPTGFVWDDANDRVVVKKGPDGLIDNDVYTMFVGGPNSANDKYFTAKAIDQIKSDPALAADVFDDEGKIIDQDKFDQTKRNVVASYLEKFTPKVKSEIEKQLPPKNETRVTVINSGDKPTVGSDWMKEMETVWAGGDVAKIDKKLSTLYAGGTRLESVKYDGNNIVAKFKSGSKDPITGDPLPSEVVIPKSDPNALTKIAGLYQTARGADKGAEAFIDKKIKVF